MDPSYIDLTYGQVALAAMLILINAAVSVALQLGLEKTLLLASVRTLGQLILVGLILNWVFAVRQWYLVLSLGLVMTCIAGFSAVQRTRAIYPGIWTDAILAMFVSSWIVTGFALAAVIRPPGSLLDPQYAIPLVGMVLGNALNGISLGLNGFTSSVMDHRYEAETLLALGATRWEAARGLVQKAVHNGMVPIINSMMVVGIVSLPGMMTGQILSGVEPMAAVKYQMVIMFLIAGATALGTVFSVLRAFLRLFNRDHTLQHWLVQESSKSARTR